MADLLVVSYVFLHYMTQNYKIQHKKYSKNIVELDIVVKFIIELQLTVVICLGGSRCIP